MYLFTDNITYFLMESLSSESISLIESLVSLVSVMTECKYANDSFLTFGIPHQLIDIAKSTKNEEISIKILEALRKMDYNTDYIDFNSLIDSLKDLLDFQSVKIVNLTLLCFVTITNKCSQVVFHLKDLNLFPKFISFFSTNDFISASLNLIGNLCIPYGFSE